MKLRDVATVEKQRSNMNWMADPGFFSLSCLRYVNNNNGKVKYLMFLTYYLALLTGH